MTAIAREARIAQRGVAWLLPGISSGTVIALFVTLYFALRMGSRPVEDGYFEAMLWGVAYIGVFAAALGSILLAGVAISRELDMEAATARKATIAGVFSMALVAIVAKFFVHASGGAVVSLENIIGVPDNRAVIHLVEVMNALVVVAIVLIIVASCLLSRDPRRPMGFHKSTQLNEPEEVFDVAARLLAERKRWMAMLLYASAALLLIGLVEIYCLFRLADVLGSKESGVASNLTIAAGGSFSVLLLAIHVPVAVVQRQWVDALVQDRREVDVDIDVEKWLSSRNLNVSLLRVMGSALAILAPVLASGIVKSFTN